MNRWILTAIPCVLVAALVTTVDAAVSPLRRTAPLQRAGLDGAAALANGKATPEALKARWGAPNSQAPVIGIFTNDLTWSWVPSPPFDLPHYDRVTEWTEGLYVKWLEAAGVRVVPFPWNATFTEQQALMRKVNGVLFPGGLFGADMPQYYVDKVAAILDQAKEWNAQGDPFFVWGTAQGLEVLAAAAAQRDLAAIAGPYNGLFPSLMPIDPTPAFWNSALYGAAPASVVNALTSQAATLYWTHECILNTTFATHPTLAATFEPLSTHAVPNSSLVFVSSFEGKNGLNVFATQYQPERPPLCWSDPSNADRDGAIEISQYLSRFIRGRLMRNTHQFPSRNELEAAVIENFPSTYDMYGAVSFYTWH
jgi:hypothetical protein